MNTLNRTLATAGMMMLAGLMLVVSGCSENPAPVESSSPVQVLQRQPRAKPAEGEATTIEDSTLVTPTAGGAVAVGDAEIGNSSVDVPADAVDEADLVKIVKMKVQRIGSVTAELYPSGKQFKRAVMVVISYKGADLTGVDETKLAIFYLNEATSVWELVPGSVVDVEKKKVSAPLWHFSQYAIGSNG